MTTNDPREIADAEYESEHPSCWYCGDEIMHTLAGWIHVERDAQSCAEPHTTWASPGPLRDSDGEVQAAIVAALATQAVEAIERGDAQTCLDCGEVIFYGFTDSPSGALWLHVEPPDEAHRAEPECTCEEHDDVRNPLCRVHGHEDVTSGAYDLSDEVRRHIHRELGRSIER